MESNKKATHSMNYPAPIAVFELDPNGIIIQFSVQFQKILKIPEEKILKSNFSDYIFPEDLVDLTNFFESFKSESGFLIKSKLRVIDGDGNVLCLNLIPLNNSKNLNHLFLAEDITNFHEKEVSFNEIMAKFESIIKSMSDGVFFIDRKGYIIRYNDKVKEIFNFKNAELDGLQECEFNETFYNEDGTVLQNDKFPPFLVRKTGRPILNSVIGIKNGNEAEKWISMNVIPIFDSTDDGGTGVVCTLNDITERKETELRLLQSTKLATLGELSASIAHEIKNPLSIILAKVDLIIKRNRSSDGLVQAKLTDLENIRATAVRINKIVNGLKSFSRTGASDPFEKVKLKDIIEDCVCLTDAKFKNGCVDLRVSYDNELELECRFVQISQVIFNLLNNAFDAIQNISEMWVAINALKLDATSIEISITDCGPGIPKEIADRLMNPFFTTKTRGNGTGLGLSIAKKIIEAHNGDFFLDRNSSNTRFVIRLPINHVGN